MTEQTGRAIVGNLFVTYIIFPIFYIKDYWGNLISQNYVGQHFHYDSLLPYLDRIFNGFFLFSTVLLLFSLLPYHIIKLYNLYKVQRNFYLISLIMYIAINFIIMCITGYGFLVLTSFGSENSQVPFVLTLIVFSAIVHALIYVIVDRHYRIRNKVKSAH